MTNSQELRDAVHRVYSAISQRPWDEHPFSVGRALAENVGYPKELLDSLPSASMEPFCGVSNVAVLAEIPEGASVLDLGCGAGLDSLIAAQRTGNTGRVLGVDFSDAMLERACRGAKEAGLGNVCFCRSDAETLPVEDGRFDVALVNGIFNLNPARDMIFRELARVMRPGGFVFASEIILKEPLPPKIQESEVEWFT